MERDEILLTFLILLFYLIPILILLFHLIPILILIFFEFKKLLIQSILVFCYLSISMDIEGSCLNGLKVILMVGLLIL